MLHEQFNLTPFRTGIGFCQDRNGCEIAVGLLKATFSYAKNGQIAQAPRETSLPVFHADVYSGAAGASSLRYASDAVPAKVGTDIAVIGHVFGHGAKHVAAGFRVGCFKKALSVFGPRCWMSGLVSGIAGPNPFTEVALAYEHAFGGCDVDGAGAKHVWRENPLGVGFCVAPRNRTLLPAFEYPGQEIKLIGDRPRPAGLGFIPPGWACRAAFAGTFDAAWETSRRPLFPADFDERFYNAVPQDQVVRGELGGAEVGLRNLDRRAEWIRFVLPRLAFIALFRVKERQQEVPMQADTLVIEPDHERFALGFRASYPLADDVKYLASVTFRCVSPT